MPVSLPIQGDDFILREFLPSDAVAIADIEFDSEVKRFLSLPEKPKNEWIKDFRHLGIRRGWVIETGRGEVAGSGTLERAKRKGDAEIRVVIGKRFWGLALGSKVAKVLIKIAFEDLSAKAVVAFVHPENIASLRLVRSLRFRRRGVVTEPEGSWQMGHYIYRLPRNVYNSPFNRTPKRGAPLAIGLLKLISQGEEDIKQGKTKSQEDVFLKALKTFWQNKINEPNVQSSLGRCCEG